MGLDIQRTQFTADDFRRFREQLDNNLAALQLLLERPGFGQGSASFGAELELYIIDKTGRPCWLNTELQAQLNDPLLTLELNRFNLEYNLSPALLCDKPFSQSEAEMLSALTRLNQLAADFQARVLPIGILPTLQQTDFGPHAMTDTPRYHVLTEQLRQRRGEPFHITLDGDKPIDLRMEDVTLEGANTSFQIHYRVDPAQFSDTYNALQLVTPLILAVGANSPTLFGHRLWQETRIPLFKKSVDCRTAIADNEQEAAVSFGHDWLNGGALQLFSHSAYHYPSLIPVCSDEDALAVTEQGKVPELYELRLQQGSVWLWNRPVYDAADGGHLRIEMRSLPAGPTPKDMLANAALTIGLMEYYKNHMDEITPRLSFAECKDNFYRCAQFGLSAKVSWPDPGTGEIQRYLASELLPQLLSKAEAGLASTAIAASEYRPYLAIIAERLAQKQNGASWQLQCLDRLQQSGVEPEACFPAMLMRYQKLSLQNIPIAQWPLP